MLDLLLPRTDGGAGAQALVAAIIYIPLLWTTRRNRDVLTFVLGLAVMTFAWFALRLVH